MQIEVKIESSCTEPRIIVVTDKVTSEINRIIDRLSEGSPQILSGFQDNQIKILEQSDLIRVYANSGKVFAVSKDGEYVLRLRLYEVEERLDKDRFVRISNSEIINIRRAESFDLSFTGTICVKLSNNTVTYVSRRYVRKIKKILGI